MRSVRKTLPYKVGEESGGKRAIGESLGSGYTGILTLCILDTYLINLSVSFLSGEVEKAVGLH